MPWWGDKSNGQSSGKLYLPFKSKTYFSDLGESSTSLQLTKILMFNTKRYVGIRRTRRSPAVNLSKHLHHGNFVKQLDTPTTNPPVIQTTETTPIDPKIATVAKEEISQKLAA